MKKIIITLLIITPLLSYAHQLKGHASWYGGKFIGRPTANGEIFDTTKLTAAHKTLPFNTVVEVINKSNGKRVQVRINDRGPFIDGRVIDLSKKAASKIDMLKSGTADVTIKVIEMPEAPQVMDIQVAAYSNFIYATAMKKRLKEAGFEPSTSMSNKGIMRVMLKEVPINSTFYVVQKLEKMGIDKILIKHRG